MATIKRILFLLFFFSLYIYICIEKYSFENDDYTPCHFCKLFNWKHIVEYLNVNSITNLVFHKFKKVFVLLNLNVCRVKNSDVGGVENEYENTDR